MKLADSWVGEPPTAIPSEPFYDEVEELDEVDESKDGCGAVVWQPYVLKKAHTSNKMLHELAREIRGVEQQHGKELRVNHYKTIFDNWESASRAFLQPNHDYFTDFLAKLDCVTVPKGQTLGAAFERAKRRQPPSKALMIANTGVQLLATLCQELQDMTGDQPFHAAPNERRKIVHTVATNDFQLDSGTKDSRTIEIGRSRNPEY